MENAQVSNPFQPSQRRKGGGLRKLFFILFLAVLIISWMRSCQPPPQSPPTEPIPPLPPPKEPNANRQPSADGQRHSPQSYPGDSDWSLEEVEVRKKNSPTDGVSLTIPKSSPVPGSKQPVGTKRPESKRTDKGDWSIEEVESDSHKVTPSSKQKTASNLGEKPKNHASPKKTTKGDWEIEEVE